MKSRRTWAILFVLAWCWVLPAQGQGITGSITGVVRDPGGGVIPGVEVTVLHTGTNAVYRGVSNDIGVYTIRALPIGRYDLTAELAGFKRFEAAAIRVQVDESVRVDVQLQLGELTESVQVTAGIIGVDTQSSTLKTVVDQRRVEELPLDGRDPVALMRLVAGVATASVDVTSGTTYPGVVPVTVSGSRGNATNYILDGGQNNDHYSNAPNPMPNPDALAEFSVQTSNFSAEHGRNMGAVVNAVTKSGTNRIHGSAFGYLRNSALNAANFFAPPKPGNPTEKQDDGLKRSQFGGTIGGPVWLGNFYDGRDKTFFFFSYQGTRLRRTPTTRFVNTFTAAERQGDFSALSTPLIDPLSGEPFPNNQIPSDRHNPVARHTLDNLMALPTEGRQISFTSFNNFDDDQTLVKVDHNLTSNNVLTGRYYRSFAQRPGFLDQRNLYNQTYETTWLNTSVVLRDTHTFGPSLINESLFSFNRTDGTDTQNKHPERNFGQMGVQNIGQDDFAQIYFSIQGLSGINTGETETFDRDEYQATNTLRWTKGSHQLSMGGEFAYGKGDIASNFYSNGRFWFEHSAGWTGHAPADFLIGKFARWSQGLGEFKNTRFRRFNLFVHDSMRLTPRLSMDLGLRWEPFFPYYDALGKLSVWVPGRQSTRYINAPEGILYPGDADIPRGGYDTSWNNFAPRVGFAYDLTGDGRTALRAGYGIFYDLPNTIFTNAQASQGPFGTRVDYFGNPSNDLSNPWGGFPGGNPLPVVGFSAVGTDALDPPADVPFIFPHTAMTYSPAMRNAYMQSWNLTLEHQLGEVVLRSAYVGTKGTALISGRDVNAPFPDPTASTATTNERRPLYPNFARVAIQEGVGNSIYHGLQLTGERRFNQGYTVLANYTWSKALDNNVGSANKGGGTSVTNPLDQSFDRGTSNFDRTHVFNFSGLWEMPFHFENGLAQGVLGGWNLTSIVSLHSGTVFSVFSGQDNARTGQGSQRADLVGDPYALGDDRSRGEFILQYLNRDAFAPNALGTYGNLGRNTFRAPGYAGVDLGLHKRFPITEEVTAQFRFEMFNAFNRVNLNNPTDNLTSGNFMRITSAGDPRILQFALRFAW